MRKFHSIAALCGDGLRPELQALFDRLAIDQNSELFVRGDGMVQSGPDPVSETNKAAPAIPKRVAFGFALAIFFSFASNCSLLSSAP